MLIGEKIRQRRKQLGLSQEQIANAVGVSKKTISDYEVNKSSPSDKMIVQLTTVLECDANYLFSDFISTNNSAPLTQQEQKIIDVMRDLNDDGINELIQYSDYISKKEEFKKIYSSAKEA